MIFTSIEQAKHWLRGKALEEGAKCPVCNRYTKIYKRSITSSMAIFLIKFWNRHKNYHYHEVKNTKEYFHCGDYGKLAYWGLLKSKGNPGIASKSSGYWAITEKGERFARNRLEVPKYCYVYDNNVLSLKGDPVSITDCLTNKYSYEEIFTA